MAEILNMPKLGMDMEEGTVLAWKKQVGDAVKKGEVIAEIETDKASMEFEATADGVILAIYCKEDEAVPVGTPIAAIGAKGEAAPAAPAAAPAEAAPAAPTAAPAAPAPAPAAAVDFENMPGVLLMPKLGMDMEEGTVLAWKKQVGDAVKKGEVIAEIETDKASMELEATMDGILLATYCAEGEAIPVKTPLAFFGAKGDTAPDFSAPAAAAPVAAPAPAATAPAPVSAPAAPAAPAVKDGVPMSLDGKRLRTTPRARRLAQQEGIDLAYVTATGPNGRIVEQDVRLAMMMGSGNVRHRPAGQRGETVKPVAGIRKVIANRMHQSLSEMAQANHRMDADMTNMIALRKQLNGSAAFADNKISFMDLLVLACTRALQDCPFANVSMMADGIHQKNFVNVGVAVDTERGLVVPVLKDTDCKDLAAISRDNKEVIAKARDGKLTPDEMSGGTFTISNLGMFGIDSFTAIINPPETCILAVGRIAEKPVVVDGAITVRSIMTLSLTYDHRVLDGAPAARLLQKIRYYIENPALLLL